MMITEDVYNALVNGATTAGTRVWAKLMKQGESTPAITYAVISTAPTISLNGSRKPDRVRIQVDCWAAGYGAAWSLAGQVRTVMQAAGFQGMLEDGRDDFEVETNLYRVSQDFFCWSQ